MQGQNDVKFNIIDLKELVKTHINPVCCINGRKLDESNDLFDSICLIKLLFKLP